MPAIDCRHIADTRVYWKVCKFGSLISNGTKFIAWMPVPQGATRPIRGVKAGPRRPAPIWTQRRPKRQFPSGSAGSARWSPTEAARRRSVSQSPGLTTARSVRAAERRVAGRILLLYSLLKQGCVGLWRSQVRAWPSAPGLSPRAIYRSRHTGCIRRRDPRKSGVDLSRS